MKRSQAKGRDAVCEHCGEAFLATQEFKGYQRRYCSSPCSGAALRAKAVADYPPREDVWRAYQVEGLSDRAFGARYDRTYHWAFKVRRHYGIDTPTPRDKHLRKNGGPKRWKHSNGYILVSTAEGHEYEHRLVAAQMLGRPLKEGEVVHHKDGNPANNDPGNLQVFGSHSEHMKAERPPKPKDRSPGYSAGRFARQFNLKKKGEETCRNCGGWATDLHHAIPRSVCRATRADLRNGLPLCRRCHQGWHHRKVVLHRNLFTEEEWAYLSSVELTGQRIEAWLEDHYPERVMYDRHEIDLLGSLTLEEQLQAVRDAGGIELARRLLAPLAYRD